jgi:hypothetical protein
LICEFLTLNGNRDRLPRNYPPEGAYPISFTFIDNSDSQPTHLVIDDQLFSKQSERVGARLASDDDPHYFLMGRQPIIPRR